MGIGALVFGLLAMTAAGTANAADDGAVAFGFVLIGIAIFLYFIPALIASRREHPQRRAITILNIFLGWTFLGWVIALVWAFTAKPAVQAIHDDPVGEAYQRVASGMRKCPFCAEDIKVEAIKCKHCGSDLAQKAA